MKHPCAALAAASLFVVPALLAPGAALARPREAVTMSVSTEGYDLARLSDVVRLRGEIGKRIDAACNPDDRIGQVTPDWQCRREMRASADAALSLK
ncbi:UrcA family protein [Novosphingobium sp. KCTC 2891]|uniref:UrcA family protein n=1 Tax=Novosphingobium sp. KCTC 2891 TaxID=2989730 RepID=UPI002221F062|nr:UrcA family protein [Novosphingobium sp. KCTC 2891]MCW1381404.1 UrcA family protein [Novosphingobium sp. KCTC 2891]